MLDYLRAHARACATSWSPAGTWPTCPGRGWRRSSAALLDIDNIRDIRLATKALMGLPQHWLSDEVRAGMERLAGTARERGVSIAIHTHVNAAQSVTPLVARATAAMLDTGIRDVRNQGVLLRGVNDSAGGPARPVLRAARRGRDHALLLLHVRHDPGQRALAAVAGRGARHLQHEIMGYLPGFATPRMVCDVPYVGKRWVHQVAGTTPTAASPTGRRTTAPRIEADDELALSREYPYYDPIYMLPEAGQAWWRAQRSGRAPTAPRSSASPTRTG